MAARRSVAVGKAYLNRREKDQVYIIAGMVAMLNEWIERGEDHQEKVTELKYARTYLYKHLDSKMGHLPQEDVEMPHFRVKVQGGWVLCKIAHRNASHGMTISWT